MPAMRCFEPPSTRADPVQLLEQQAKTRVPELVPIRYGRMLVSPFTFYRGAALIMAHDLEATPRSGLTVQCCGDAHLSNFGVFASPERKLVFDVNDFDETLPGPWEWDVKRLAVSMLIAARSNGFRAKEQDQIVLDTVGRYRTAMATFAGMKDLDVWYAHLDIEDVLQDYASQFKPKTVKRTEKTLANARTKDSMTAFSKLTHVVDGKTRIVDQSPLIVPIEQLEQGETRDETFEGLHQLLRDYRRDARVRPPSAARAVRVERLRSQGGRGRERRYARVYRADARPRRPGPAVPADERGRSVGTGRVPRPERVRKPRRTGGRRTATDAGCQRHLPRLAARRRRARRQTPRLLRPAAEGLEGVRRDRADGPEGHGHLRQAVRLDARPCARPQR